MTIELEDYPAELGGIEPAAAGATLQDRFLVPPFSVLDARQAYWQDRKRGWVGLGIKSELGRAANLMGGQAESGDLELGAERVRSGVYGAKATTEADGSLSYETTNGSTSIFDPVVCEIAYRWWCPPGGVVLDPFAGGSVRGVVAAHLGREYLGIDLRADQVAANEAQWAELGGSLDPAAHPAPSWLVGDSLELLGSMTSVSGWADYVFTCPPYGDLEVYSDDPADLSTMSYPVFREAYSVILGLAAACLRDDRFACVVVGDFRDPGSGAYRGFVGDTVRAMQQAGLELYNDAVLVTPTGTLPVRSGRYFTTTRKLGKGHQNVLVFLKGDARRATEACGMVELNDGLVLAEQQLQLEGLGS